MQVKIPKLSGFCPGVRNAEKKLLQENTTLALSLTRRDPYLDPLNYIQITLLKRVRSEVVPDTDKDVWLKPLLRSINGIASGMRNTG